MSKPSTIPARDLLMCRMALEAYEAFSLHTKQLDDKEVFEHKGTDTQGFVRDLGNGRGALVFRGTSSFRDIRTDVRVGRVRIGAGMFGHKGFHDAWLSVRPQVLRLVEPFDELDIGGHSLGGALGHNAAFDLTTSRKKLALITFGSPRFGNMEVCRKLTAGAVVRRYRHGWDGITAVPRWLVPSLGEIVTGKLDRFVRLAHAGESLDIGSTVAAWLPPWPSIWRHSLTRYLAAMEALPILAEVAHVDYGVVDDVGVGGG